MKPEIIVRNANRVDIISSDGNVLQSLPSMSVEGEALHFIQSWKNKTGIIDGQDIYLFDETSLQGLDFQHNIYWGHPGGASNNEPIVNGGIHSPAQIISDNIISSFYNYPNPILSLIHI